MATKEIESQGGTIEGREVTVKANGTKVRFDLVADIDGKTTFVEVKTGLRAGFTPNQKIVYSDILLNKPTLYPIGQNAAKINFKTPISNYNFIVIRFYF